MKRLKTKHERLDQYPEEEQATMMALMRVAINEEEYPKFLRVMAWTIIQNIMEHGDKYFKQLFETTESSSSLEIAVTFAEILGKDIKVNDPDREDMDEILKDIKVKFTNG